MSDQQRLQGTSMEWVCILSSPCLFHFKGIVSRHRQSQALNSAVSSPFHSHHTIFLFALFSSILQNYLSFTRSGGCHLKNTKQLNQYDNKPLDSSIYSNDCLLLESESDCGFDDEMGPEGQAGLSSTASIDLSLKWTSSDCISMLNISPHMPAEDIKT